MTTKYVYPAIFEKEDCGYSVYFPDVEGCVTSGTTLAAAIEAAQDALCLMLYDMEERKEQAPAASDISAVKCGENQFCSLIDCDTMDYRKFYDKKAVKKTLTIPSWLNTMAEREEINFSAVLQKALRAELNI